MAACSDKDCFEGAANNRAQRRILWVVLVINAVMFMAMLLAALWGDSSALFADSFDNLGDAITYAISIWAVGKGAREKAKVSLMKGLLILGAGLAILAHVVTQLIHPDMPSVEVMGVFSLAALIANLSCLALLWKHKGDDLNMKSVWHCSRNDIMANLSVFITAGLVWVFHSWWPDVIVALALALMMFWSAWEILRASIKGLHKTEPEETSCNCY